MTTSNPFTEREWRQVLAALKFWRQVAEHSRMHPSRHPAVGDTFGTYRPLTIREIEELVGRLPEQANLITPEAVQRLYGVKPITLGMMMRKEGVEPAVVGKAYLLEDVERVLEIRERAKEAERRWLISR